jgi:hypothetical protein
MRSAWVDAERASEVREAARDWKQAGAIDAAALTAIEAEFPEPRLEVARAWKVLILALVSVAILGVQFAVFGFDANGSSRFFVYTAILAGVTEFLRGSRLSGTGSDAATSFWAVVNLIVGFGVLLDAEKGRGALTATLAVAGVAFAAACWRWGFALYGAFAAAAGFFFLARFPSGRFGWAVVGAALCALSAWLAERPRLAPSRRRAFAGVFVVSALAVYAAINLYSRDERLIERVWSRGAAKSMTEAAISVRPAFAVSTALVPILFVLWGVRARRRLVLDTGALLAALSFLTLYHYVRFGSLPIITFGLALIGAALWLNRRLTRSPGGEARGFTASPILSAESEALAPAAALAAAAAAPVSPPRSDTDFSPGGGRYGGGGATGTF